MDQDQGDQITGFVQRVLNLMREDKTFMEIASRLPPWAQDQSIQFSANAAVSMFLEGLTPEDAAKRLTDNAAKAWLDNLAATEMLGSNH